MRVLDHIEAQKELNTWDENNLDYQNTKELADGKFSILNGFLGFLTHLLPGSGPSHLAEITKNVDGSGNSSQQWVIFHFPRLSMRY